MIPSFKKVSILIWIVVMLHDYAYSQPPASALSLYKAGESMLTKNPEKAFQLLVRAMTASRENKDWDLYMKSVNVLAAATWDSDDHRAQVFTWLKEAYPLLSHAEKNNEFALLHYNIAEFYNRITIEIDTPIFHYEEALKIWTALKGELSAEVSDCYHGLGNIYKYYKFDFFEAEKCYEKALSIREKIGFHDSLKLYRNYYSLAATNRSQFDFEKALSYAAKTLNVARLLEPRRIELANGMIANIYRDMGQLDLAKKHYLNALALNKKTNDLDDRAWYYSSLGEMFERESLHDEAIQNFNQAYTIYKRSGVVYRELFMNLIIQMMNAYSKKGDDKNFLKFKHEIFDELASLSKLQSKEAAQAWQYVGDHHFRKLRYDSSLYYYQKALIAAVPGFTETNTRVNPTDGQIGLNYYVNEILTGKAFALRKKFDITQQFEFLRQCLACLRLAEKLIALQRNTLDLEVAKWKFTDANYNLYEDILSTLFEASKDNTIDSVNTLAFQYAEQSKARSLADALTEAEFTNQITDDDSLFRTLNNLKRELFTMQDFISREPNSGSAKVYALRDSVVRIDRKIQICKTAIEERHPGYFKVKYGYKTVSVKEVQQTLKEKKQILLEYFWGNNSIYGIGVSEDKILFKKIGVTDSVKRMTDNLLTHFTEGSTSLGIRRFNLFSSNAHQLYNALVKPFKDLISDETRIQIIPDGAVSQIPFEILIEEGVLVSQVDYKSLRYLIQSFSIGYAYSSAMLLHETGQPVTSTPSLLAIGFTGGQILRDSPSRLNVIEGTEEELQALKNRFAGGRFLQGNEATESNFKTLAPRFDIIHLAIHGIGDKQKDFAASLYFSDNSEANDDGELHAYELYGLKLKALMAVLSACESGLGRGYKGEGMISMASAFSFSGCENILMSLWKVSDQTSINLMDNFYSYLMEGKTIDEALQSSKLNYLESADELTADPKVWAPLVAYGSLDVIFEHNKNRLIQVVALVIFLAIVLLLFRRILRRKIKS